MKANSTKVLMVVQNSFTSDSRVLRIAGSIASRGVNVRVLALEGPGLPERECVSGFEVRRLRLASRRVTGKLVLPFKAAEYVSKVFVECVRSGAEVYHIHDPLPLSGAAAASWLTGAKVVYDVHELHFATPRIGKLGHFFTRVYEGLAIRAADRVIMSDGASRTALFRSAHRYRRPIDYIYNCPLPVDYPGPKYDLREALRIPAGAQVVAFSGNVGRDRALDRVVASVPSWPAGSHFVMLGKTTDNADRWLLDIAREVDVADRVHLYGPVPPHDVVRWLMSANVASTIVENVGASYYNSAPTKMFEAIMARLPQVASNFPEIRRVVRENSVGPVGELVDPADTRDIGRAIAGLLSDVKRQNEYRRNADQLARSCFNWHIEEAKLFATYDAVAPGLLPTPARIP